MSPSKIKQSFCYPCFKGEWSFDQLCKTAAGIGFPAIELWFRDPDFEELVSAARKHGLAIASMCGHGTLEDGMNKRSNHDRILSELTQSFEIASQLKIPNLICFSGNRNPSQADQDAIDACAECLKRAAPEAEKRGINLNLELLNSKVDHPGYQCDHAAWGVAVCRKVNSPRVKLLYDIYHMQIMEGDLIRTIRDNIQWIGHFHTAGNPGRHDLDHDQELNYPAICRAIVTTGYEGYLAHEFYPKADQGAALRRAFEVCNL